MKEAVENISIPAADNVSEQNEFERLGKKAKLIASGFLLMSALAMDYAKPQEVEAAQKHPRNAVAANFEKQFEQGANGLWALFESELQEYKHKGSGAEQLKKLDELFLNIVHNTHTLGMPDDVQQMEQYHAQLAHTISDWISRYAFSYTGEFSPQLHETWIRRLARTVERRFDKNNSGKLERDETEKLSVACIRYAIRATVYSAQNCQLQGSAASSGAHAKRDNGIARSVFLAYR